MSSASNNRARSPSPGLHDFNRQRSITRIVQQQLSNRFQQLQVTSDIRIGSMHPTIPTITTNIGGVLMQAPHLQQAEALAEEELIDRLKEIMNEFMIHRPGQHYSYNTTMRWTVDHGNQLNYSVVILINQPSELI